MDLIVFDTYTKLVGTEHNKTWENIEPLLNGIKAKGIAILLIHHSKIDGNSRGQCIKDDDLSVKIKLGRKNNKASTLEEPITIEFEKMREGNVSSDFESFEIQLTDNKWHVPQPDRTVIQEEFCLIAKEYKRNNYSRDAIAQMLRMGKTAYSEKLKECGNKSKKKKY